MTGSRRAVLQAFVTDGTKLSNTFRFVDRSDQRSSAHFVIRLRDNKADIEVFVNPKAGDQLTKTASDAEHREDTVRVQSSAKRLLWLSRKGNRWQMRDR